MKTENKDKFQKSRLKGGGPSAFKPGSDSSSGQKKWSGRPWQNDWNTPYPMINLSDTGRQLQRPVLDHNCQVCPANGLKLIKNPRIAPEFYYTGNEGDPTIMIVGEAPGEEEDSNNRSFIGRSGQLLRSILKRTDIGGYNIYLTNVAKCRPPTVIDSQGNKSVTPSLPIINTCVPTLFREIEEIQPALIVALGGTAANQLLGMKNASVSSLRTPKATAKSKQILDIDDESEEEDDTNDGEGIINPFYQSNWDIPVLVTYHPSAATRNGGFGTIIHFDIAKSVLNTVFDLAPYRKPGKVHHIKTLAELEAAVELAEQQEALAFDFETESLSRERGNNKCLSLMWSFNIDEGYGVLYDHKDAPWTAAEKPQVAELLRRLLTAKMPKIGHNIKFDIAIAKITLDCIVHDPRYDTMLMQYLLDENIVRDSDSGESGFSAIKSGLDWMARFWLNYVDPAWAITKDIRDKLATIDGDQVVQYGVTDTIVTFRLWKVMMVLLRAKDPAILEHPITILSAGSRAMAEIEIAGLPIDRELATAYLDDDNPKGITSLMRTKYAELMEVPEIKDYNHIMNEQQKDVSLWAVMGEDEQLFTPSKTRHLAGLYYDYLKLSAPEGTKEGSRPTGKEFAEEHQNHPIVKAIQEYKEIDKMRSFIEIFIKESSKYNDGRIRASFGINRTVTGRPACTNPNLQQIPRATDNPTKAMIKRLVKAPPGYAIVHADYSVAEVRMGVILSRDEKFADKFRQVDALMAEYRKNPTKELYKRIFDDGEADIHRQNYSNVFGVPVNKVTKKQRSESKGVTFGVMFSEFPEHQLSEKLGMPVDTCKELATKFLGPYPKFVRFLNDCTEACEAAGFTKSGFDRYRTVYNAWTFGKPHKSAKNQTRNMPIQSTSSDITLLAAEQIADYITANNLSWQIVNLVHDAIYFLIPIDEIPDAAPVIERFMVNPGLERFGDHLQFIQLAIDFDFGINATDIATWDFSPNHLDLIINWLKAGGTEKPPYSPYKVVE